MADHILPARRMVSIFRRTAGRGTQVEPWSVHRGQKPQKKTTARFHIRRDARTTSAKERGTRPSHGTGARVVCYECGNENASMNLVCAYCGFPFARDHIAAGRREPVESEPIRFAVLVVGLVLALVVPVVGLVAGFSAMRRSDPAHQGASRRWLVAALCSCLAYIALLMGYLVL
ncbi:MAG TPA: hypothetical protein VF516_33065 [Kofleriaceae bacterium]